MIFSCNEFSIWFSPLQLQNHKEFQIVVHIKRASKHEMWIKSREKKRERETNRKEKQKWKEKKNQVARFHSMQRCQPFDSENKIG